MATIRKRDTGNGLSYQVQIRLKGYPMQTATFERLSDAKRWAQQTETAIREGRHFKTTEAKKHTLGELVDRYIKTVLPTKPRSIPHQERQLLWWKTEIGVYLLADVTPALIVQCRDKLMTQPTHQSDKRAPATVVRYMAALSHAFTVAVNEWGWIEDNPMRKVKRPSEPRGRVRFLDEEERGRLLEACRESSNPILHTVVLLALSTGMRQAEILNLHWKEPKTPPTESAWGVVHLEQRRIILHDTKNGEKRTVPLAAKALDALNEHNKVRRIGSTLVFPGGNGRQPADIRGCWKKVVERAQLENFRFHDLRHTTASYLAMNGASLAEIADILGHKTLQMVRRYAHLSDSHVAGVLEDMNRKVFGA